MRITKELAPVVPQADTKVQETAAGDTFAALLAVAGLAVANDAAPIDCGSTGAATLRDAATDAIDTGAGTGAATAEALAAMAVLVPTISGTGLPVGATATTAPTTGPDPATALPAPAVGTSAAADAATATGPGHAEITGITELARATATGAPSAPVFDMEQLDITVETDPITAGTAPKLPVPGTTAPGTMPGDQAPAATPVLDTAAADLASISRTTPTPLTPEQTSADANDLTAETTGAATTTAGPVPGPVPGSRAAVTSTSMADRPIPPSRLSDVALAAARTSSEAGRPVRLTVRLDPPNLGEVRVELVARNGTVTVRVEPVHDAAAPLLAHQRDAVAAALERTGLSLSSFDVTPGEPERRQAPQSKRTVRIAELTATDEANTDEPTAGRTGLRI